MALDKQALESLRLDADTDPQRYRGGRGGGRRRLWIGLAVVAVFAAAFAWRLVNSPVEVKTVLVETPEGAADAAVLNASGYVVARQLATVSSKVTGRITEVLFEEGAVVAAGQVLAKLDASTARAEHAVASSSLEAARRDLREIEVRLGDARKTLARTRGLIERKLVAESTLDTAVAEVAALEARLAAAGAGVEVSRSRLALSQQALDDHLIRAPFSGVVLSKDAQPGEMVSPVSAGGGFTRTGIATIVDMDSREIEVDVNEAYINRVADGQRVEAVLDAYPEWNLAGRVISIVPTADRQKATVRVRIAFEALDPRILPDMGIKVRFLEDGAQREQAHPSVPSNAVLRDGGTAAVWVVGDGKVERRSVTLGAEDGDRVAVLEGLQGGEAIVVDAPRRLRDGAAVQLKAD